MPADPEELRKTIGATPAEFRSIWLKIESKLPIAEDGRRRNPRLERERKRGRTVSAVRSQLGRLGAAKRWSVDGNSHGNSQPNAAAQDGNSHSKIVPSTPTVRITITKDPDSEPNTSRKRARPADPDGPPARPDVVVLDESDPEIQKRRRQAAALAESSATKPPEAN
jgi:hypothetical protein